MPILLRKNVVCPLIVEAHLLFNTGKTIHIKNDFFHLLRVL